MPEWLSIVLALGGSAIISGIVGFVINRNMNKFFSKKDLEEENRRKKDLEYETFKAAEIRKQRREDVQGAIDSSLLPIKNDIVDIKDDIGILHETDDLQRKGIQALLRDRLYQLDGVCCERGFATTEDKNNFENMYLHYHSLGRNGVMDAVHEHFMALPSSEVAKKTKSSSKGSSSSIL